MSKMGEHALEVEILADEVWRSVYRLKGVASPRDLATHLETLEMAEASWSVSSAQIKQKKAA